MYQELGGQLEAYAAKYPGRAVEAGALAQAAQAFLAEGDQEAELRVMRKALARNALSGALLDRYLSLLAARHRDELLDVARSNSSAAVRNRAVQFAIAADAPEFAYSAVRARGNAMPPVWTSAFTALAGLYLGDHAPGVDGAFQATLDTRTIGERLQASGKPNSVVLGPVWFYYGARYGDYLTAAGSSEAEAWLPASLEASPGNPDAYLALGDAYAGARQSAKAIAEFEHVLELDSDRGDAQDRIACVLWSEGRRAEAIARWKAAFDTFLQIQSRGVRVPEPFWGRVAHTFTNIGERHAVDLLRPEIAHLLGDYYQRNNQYRLDELLRPAARASITSGAGTDWLVELGRAMGDPEMMLYALMRVPDLTAEQRISVQRDLAAVRAKQVESNFGDQRGYAETQAVQARWQLVRLLLDAGDVKAAAAEWSLIPVESIPGFDQSVEIRLAARTGTLAALLERYRLNPGGAPTAEILQRGAVDLRRDGDEASARTVLEFLYVRELGAGRLTAANFLGLAEVKLQRNDTAGVLALLNRMALVADDPFDTLLPAAELLAKHTKTVEAADFLRRRIKAVPWDSDAKARLARTLPAVAAERAQLLAAAIGDSQATYRVRAEAARAAAPAVVAAAGTELALLSSPRIGPEAAAKPYQVEARVEAASTASTPETQLRLWREALAIAPADARARLGAVRAAIASRRDSLALALHQTQSRPQFGIDSGQPAYGGYGRRGIYPVYRPRAAAEEPAEDVTIAESLSSAAERLDDLALAISYLRTAIDRTAPAQRPPLKRRLDALTAEQQRRAANASRQPMIKDVIEQGGIVRPRLPRSAQ
jgi:tetratricopeptide (TPR) repeat protein